MSICLCVFGPEMRERERERLCVCVRAGMSACACVFECLCTGAFNFACFHLYSSLWESDLQ